MFKKFTTFVHPYLRTQLKDPGTQYRLRKALHGAVTIPVTLVTEDLHWDYNGDYEAHTERARSLVGPGWKYIDGLHHESTCLRAALREAYRIESLISMFVYPDTLQ